MSIKLDWPCVYLYSFLKTSFPFFSIIKWKHATVFKYRKAEKKVKITCFVRNWIISLFILETKCFREVPWCETSLNLWPESQVHLKPMIVPNKMMKRSNKWKSGRSGWPLMFTNIRVYAYECRVCTDGKLLASFKKKEIAV